MNNSLEFLISIEQTNLIKINKHYYNRLLKLLNVCIGLYPRKVWPNKPCNMHNHHIIPRSWGGTDSKINLITISPKLHFLIHLLMMKSFPGDTSMSTSFKMMNNTFNFKKRTGKEYSKLITQHDKEVKMLFETGKRISKRKNKVLVRNLITNEPELIDKDIFYNKDTNAEYVGFSKGQKRTTWHKEQISKAQFW